MNEVQELIVKNLKKSYGKRTVIKDISLNLKCGEVVGLLGPNGAGKTTSFYMIVGLIQVDKGKIILNNKEIQDYPIHQRAKLGIGYLPQDSSIFRKLSVEDNIMLILELDKSLTKKQRLIKVEDLLTEFNVTHLRKSLGMSLSGGERRRVEIARALATNPKFLLLDEPFAGVDPISVEDMQNIIIYLVKKKKIGILITDHNVRETLNVCNHAYIVGDGKIVIKGSKKEIYSNDLVKKFYLGSKFES